MILLAKQGEGVRKATVKLNDLQQRLLDQYGLRVEPAMAQYVLRRLAAGDAGKVPVIGGDARTGTPMRTLIDPARLAGDSAPSSPPL